MRNRVPAVSVRGIKEKVETIHSILLRRPSILEPRGVGRRDEEIQKHFGNFIYTLFI